MIQKIFHPTVHLVVTLVWMVVALFMIFLYAPQELMMGEVQRIFYIHLPSAWIAFVAYLVIFLGSVGYLWKRSQEADEWARAAGQGGFGFLSCVLLTGPPLAQALWGNLW